MPDGRKLLGILLGLGLAAGALALRDLCGTAVPAARTGPLVSECDGAIQELVVHYAPEAAPIAMNAIAGPAGRPASTSVPATAAEAASLS